jgi:hypothetical protein
MRAGFIAIFLLLGQITFSQDNSDMSALWSRTGLSGTARSVGSGGAFGSVGADMGCIDINPAGLGVYRSTDFSLTPLLQIGNNQAVYDGSNTFSHKVSFAIAQGGFVFTKVYKNASESNGNQMGFSERPLKSISVALNFQQTNSFDRRQYYNATNTTNSLIDEYAGLANMYNVPANTNPINFSNDPPEIAMAGLFNLVGYNAKTGTYYSNMKAPVTQAGQLETSGAINRIDFGLGGNLQDKLYFGINLAVPIINYNIYNDFVETPYGSNPSTIQQYELTTNTTETGFGFNGILGLIYRPFPFMRIGAAYHLPTWYAMTENYNINFTEDSGIYQTTVNNGQPITATPFKYGMRTPMKGTFSASFYYKQYGFLSVDYDIQNLGASRVHVPDDSTGEGASINSEIKSTYGFNHTVHAGLEAAIKIVRLRAGYYFSTTPYKSGQEVTTGYNDVRNAFTLGAGIRLTHFYVDLAYIYGWSKDASIQLSNYNFPVNSVYNSSTVLLTVGWKFEAGDKKKSSSNQQRSQPRYTPPPVDNDPRY